MIWLRGSDKNIIETTSLKYHQLNRICERQSSLKSKERILIRAYISAKTKTRITLGLKYTVMNIKTCNVNVILNVKTKRG